MSSNAPKAAKQQHPSTSTEIKVEDIVRYLDSTDDFAFELFCLNMLVSNREVILEHGGTYSDPVTNLSRQFDIRAQMRIGHRRVSFAIECKRLKPEFPLIVSCVPRTRSEAFHEIYSVPNGRLDPMADLKPIRILGGNSVYPVGSPVGKSTIQIGHNGQGGYNSKDSDSREKWAQAVASAHDLIAQANNQVRTLKLNFTKESIIPVLVVPEGMLWSCNYDLSGKRTPPTKVDSVDYFLNAEVFSGGLAGYSFTMSHVHFVTPPGLHQLLSDTRFGTGNAGRLFDE